MGYLENGSTVTLHNVHRAVNPVLATHRGGQRRLRDTLGTEGELLLIVHQVFLSSRCAIALIVSTSVSSALERNS